ncbi:hypothetical protein BLS_008436 [Venturia inaequalis]|uniref:Uncharacterized protein n=1 Tax=Venturia inaequalis TaxID=5025 RepID=A0A8H3VK71_VENIN|nr:hypothetical protein BLS_008436 [Venturia inaequalis]KAE9984117.1 hypothetical protein EG328_009168 [Venturia inaequalis]KAE9991712.1 hypothetical protein EG327_011172 [Venturia inaequalis]
MSTFILLSIAMMAPTVFSLPVPQYKLPDKSLSPEGVAAMGALTTSITTDDGGFSSTHPHPPPSYGYGGNNYNKNNGPTYETVTLDVTKAGGVGPAITYEQSYKRHEAPPEHYSDTFGIGKSPRRDSSDTPDGTATYGGETVTLDITKAEGAGDPITYEQSYKRHVPPPPPEHDSDTFGIGKPHRRQSSDTPVGTAPYGGETTTLDVTKAGGVGPPITYEQSYKRHVPPPPEHDSDTFTKPPKRESSDTPVGTATIGGLTSSLTLGDGKQKIQDNAVVMGGLTSSISLQESNPVLE